MAINAAAITIDKLRISPYTQKDDIPKIVFGDEWALTIKLPEPYQQGDEYVMALDYERIVFPADHPVCAFSGNWGVQGDELTIGLELESSRLAKWLSGLKKPTPIYIQITRIRDNVYETLLLDELLALPSMVDPDMYQDEDTPIGELLDNKLDKPQEAGTDGQVLTLVDGAPAWEDPGAASQEQADWTEADSSKPSYIRHKPTVPTKLNQLQEDATHRTVTDTEKTTWNSKSDFSGNYNDLTNKPTIPTVNNGTLTITQGGVNKGTFSANQGTNTTIDLDAGGGGTQVQADWNEADSSKPDYIKNKPTIPTQLAQLSADATHRTVTDTEKTTWNNKSDFSGSYTDLTDKPTIPTVNNGTITLTQGGVTKGTFTTNQSANQTIDLDAGGGGGTSALTEVITSAASLTAEQGKSYYWNVGAQDATLSAQSVANVDYDIPIDISIDGGTVTLSGITRNGIFADGCINRCIITKRYDATIIYIYSYVAISA